MRRIEQVFSSLRKRGEGAFIAYVCAGDPDMDFSIEQVSKLSEAGVDIVELGLPFSDPVADGPVIQAAMNRALKGGFRIDHLFEIIRVVRSRGINTPIVIMTYFNPVFQYGIERFCRAGAEAGADGLLVVDLPLEESDGLDRAVKARGLDVIRLVAPSTSDERLDAILSVASGFIYAVSAAGTTGARADLPRSAGPLLKRAVARTSSPVALGFGISTPDHVRSALSLGAAGVVEGSGLISMYSGLLSQRSEALASLTLHAKEMKRATFGRAVRSGSAQR